MVNNEEWKDEIGKVSVNIPAETALQERHYDLSVPIQKTYFPT